jgi:hypothetical protein
MSQRFFRSITLVVFGLGASRGTLSSVDASYRTAPCVAEPPAVIRYRACGASALIYLTMVSLGFVFGGLFAAAQEARTVWLDCSRATELCTIVEARPGRSNVLTSVPIASIRRTEVTTGKSSYLQLVTASGLVTVSSRGGSLSERQAEERAIDAFLASDATPSLHVDCDRPSPMAIVFLAFAVGALLSVRYHFRRAVVRFDWASRVVVVERSRWPLPVWTRAFPLDDVTGAEVSVAEGARGRSSYSVVLQIASGPDLTLLAPSASGPGHHEVAAAEIRSAIAHKEEALHSSQP